MTQIVVQEIWKNYRNTCGLIRDTINNFDDARWRKEYTWFQVPVRVARHTVECLDFYFREKGAPWSWEVSRFGRPYWATPNDRQPSQAELLTYLAEMEARIEGYFAGLHDEALGEIYDVTADPPSSTIAHLLYALRHTVHHTGSLVALADLLDVPSGEWDKWA
ncbi:MAG: DinB family protein [Anaerolineae bacterium]|jgi:uncharacterized damage-inducible protein DinB|nr:DinB family protein [Anaerolineae bacterium]